MDANDLKPFDPADIDETLTRVVVHGGKTHLLFPFVHAVGGAPKYNSIGMTLAGPAATIDDFQAMTLLVKRAGEGFLWRIVFNTPWLISRPEEGAEQQRERRA
ncbi:MAG TPA: hypothetical protein VHW71_03055 [Steroidobacteraceae bacterium]|jgi:hypothetical protein|nr:hypothetical protein [Steroidobacteraceae bacterium]